jgi:hypothetical protein
MIDITYADLGTTIIDFSLNIFRNKLTIEFEEQCCQIKIRSNTTSG